METRKLLEQTKRGEDVYKRLYFFCSWAIHPWLKKQAARDIVKPFDDAVVAGLNAKKIKPEEIAGNLGFFREYVGIVGKAFEAADFVAFRNELEAFLYRARDQYTSTP